METLRALFGTPRQRKPPSKAQEAGSQENVEPGPATSQTDANSNNSLESAPSNDKLHVMEEKFRKFMLNYIPLEDDDCFSCKLIGTATFWGGGIMVLLAGRRYLGKKQGFSKANEILVYTSLSSTLFILGTCRLLDLSIFQKSTDKSKSIVERAKDDLNSFNAYIDKKMNSKK